MALRGYLDFDDCAHGGPERFANGDASPVPRRQRLAHVHLVRREIEHRQRTRTTLQEVAAIVEGTLTGGVPQFVNEALDDEQVVRRTYTPPPSHVKTCGHVVAYPFDTQIRQGIRRLLGI